MDCPKCGDRPTYLEPNIASENGHPVDRIYCTTCDWEEYVVQDYLTDPDQDLDWVNEEDKEDEEN